MPTRLDDQAVAKALAALPGWVGDADRIQLEITTDAEESAAVVEEVMRAADEMDHHPVVERGPGTTVFTVWTHSVGGVTDLDIELARRITGILRTTGIPF